MYEAPSLIDWNYLLDLACLAVITTIVSYTLTLWWLNRPNRKKNR